MINRYINTKVRAPAMIAAKAAKPTVINRSIKICKDSGSIKKVYNNFRHETLGKNTKSTDSETGALCVCFFVFDFKSCFFPDHFPSLFPTCHGKQKGDPFLFGKNKAVALF